MAKINKRDHEKMTKAFNNRLAAAGGTGMKSRHTQIQKPLYLDKIHLDNDEFTTHSGIKQISKEFVQSAMDLENFYQGGKKKLIIAFAYDLEVELKRLGQDNLVSKISTFIMKLLKQAHIKWSPIYLRRCLDNRYKEPINQANALARKKNPGLPQDSGKTVEELEAALQAERNKTVVGEYVVKSDLKFTKDFKSDKEVKTFLGKDLVNLFAFSDNTDDKGRRHIGWTMTLPAIVRVNTKERNATIEMDMEAYNRIVKPQPSK